MTETEIEIENSETGRRIKGQRSCKKERINKSIKCCRVAEEGEMREVTELSN